MTLVATPQMIPLLRGMQLGALTAIQGAAMDTLQSRKCPFEDRLVHEAHLASLINLLLVGPAAYALVYRLTKASTGLLSFLWQTSWMTVAHSALYALIHRGMHKCKLLRPIHRFHHRYATHVTPSVANAVSPLEFLFAYMLPFALGAVVVRPTALALDASVVIVSLFNLMVHDPNLHNVPWPTYMVAPSVHLGHHKTREAHYSAPTLDWGEIQTVASRALGRCPPPPPSIQSRWARLRRAVLRRRSSN